jgi:hypothetical protein
MKSGDRFLARLRPDGLESIYAPVYRDSTVGATYVVTFYPKGHPSIVPNVTYVADGFEYVDDAGDRVEAFVTDFDVFAPVETIEP